MDVARFSDREARGVCDIRTGAAAVRALDSEGFWVVVATYEGEVTAVRFEHVDRFSRDSLDGPRRTTGGSTTDRDGDTAGGDDGVSGWTPLTGDWRTSLDRTAYLAAVEEVRDRIAAGTVYQANICRILSHPIHPLADLDSLERLVRQGNPAPHAARIRVPQAHLDVVCASPELFLRRDGARIVSEPIKGTATTAETMLAKDHAENIMIVDLVRNDLSRVCVEGSVDVEALCAVVTHPGLVHLVSTVAGELRPEVGWEDLLAATFPPGSVSGAPKSSALRTIGDLETAPRGPYCGAIGWVDADRREAELAVGIRTFWAEHDEHGERVLRFGTGAGITWGSDPEGEWEETELKAARLVGLASGRVTGAGAVSRT